MSHGSSLTRELLGDVGAFSAASGVLEDSEERQVPFCLRALLLGDSGREDSSLWKEMRNEGLSKWATMERRVKRRVPVRKRASQLFFSLFSFPIFLFSDGIMIYYQGDIAK